MCGPECALASVAQANAKKAARAAVDDRKATRAKLDKLKTRSDWMKDAQREFNKFIRARDAQKPCICCGQPLGMGDVGGSYDAGHYRSVGSAPHLRFDERNCHGQTKHCNRYGSGRAVDYRIGLIQRIGLAQVEAIEADQAPRKFTVEDLRRIVATYRAKVRELEKHAATSPM